MVAHVRARVLYSVPTAGGGCQGGDCSGGWRHVLGRDEQFDNLARRRGPSSADRQGTTEKRRALNPDRPNKKLDKCEPLIIETWRISHKTSEPTMRAAKDRAVQTIVVPQPSRHQLTLALRTGLIKPDGM